MASSKDEFDWIDDAFDDKKTAADIEKVKGAKGAGALLVVLICASAALIGFAVVFLATANW